MPYLTTETTMDEYGVIHPKGVRERVEVITNPLAIVNRTIPMALIEGSISFILDKTRKHAATIKDPEKAIEFIFDVISILNEKEAKELKDVYNKLDKYEKKKFIEDCISLKPDGTLDTSNGLYLRWEAFTDTSSMRDQLIKVYEKYSDILQPYHIFIPKPRWGRDIYIGDDCVGYQYMLMLQQSGESNFSVRSSGSISDEGLPEKSRSNKISKSWKSEKPIRFGEYELPNFEVITNPDDFALITALYRSSVDGRKYMYEAILDDKAKYNIPPDFTSRTAEVLKVYLKSLGVKIETVLNDDEYLSEYEDHTEIGEFNVGNSIIFCTPEQMYYLRKLQKIYKRFLKNHPGLISDVEEVWEYIEYNLSFKKKHLTPEIRQIFNDHLADFAADKR